MKKKKWAAFFAICLLLSTVSCTKETEEQKKILIAVETQEARKDSLERYIEVSSKISSKNQIQVASKIAGTVKKVNVSLGDFVKKGDVLFVIDDSDIRLQVNQAQAAVKSAEANYNLNVEGTLKSQIQQLESSVESYEIQYADLKKKLEDMKQLYEAGAVAKSDLDQLLFNADALKLQLDTAKKSLELSRNQIASGTQEVAEAGVVQANAGLRAAQNQLQYTEVRAEIDGVINSLSVTQGMTVSPQLPVMTISDVSKVKLHLQVSEEAISKIEEGSSAYVTVNSLSQQPFFASVSNLSKVADNQSLLYPLEVILENPKGELKPGMFATVKLILDKKEGVWVLPIDSVLQKEDRKFVYVVDESRIAREVEVTTGIQNDELIEITSGLTEGMQVVVKGQDFISNESEVNPVNAQP